MCLYKKALQKVFGKAMRRPTKILYRSNLLVMGIRNFGEGSSARPKPLIDRNFQAYAKPSTIDNFEPNVLKTISVLKNFL